MTRDEAEEELDALQSMAREFSSLRIARSLKESLVRMEMEFNSLWSPELVEQMHAYWILRWVNQIYRRWVEKLFLERSQEYSIILYMARRMYDGRDPQLLDKYSMTLLRWFRAVVELNVLYTRLYGHTARAKALLENT